MSPSKSTQPEPLPIRRTSFRPIYTRALPTHIPLVPPEPDHYLLATHQPHQFCFTRVAFEGGRACPRGADDGRPPSEGCGTRAVPAEGTQAVISLRRMTLGSGYRYLMESVAVG